MGGKTRYLGAFCDHCHERPVRIIGERCRACDTHPKRVATNLRKLLPWIIGAALILMGVRMAFATYLVMN